jgi:hypothetical protein
MKCDTRIHRYEFISLSFCSQLFKRNGFKYKKKKEAARIEYPAIRTTSFVSIVVCGNHRGKDKSMSNYIN